MITLINSKKNRCFIRIQLNGRITISKRRNQRMKLETGGADARLTRLNFNFLIELIQLDLTSFNLTLI